MLISDDDGKEATTVQNLQWAYKNQGSSLQWPETFKSKPNFKHSRK